MTLHSIIEKQYKSDEFFNAKSTAVAETLRDKSEELDPLRILKGHFQFGMHDLWEDDFEYFTILRDPLKRLISSYYFILETEDHYLHHELKQKNLSFYEYVTSGIVSNTENMMVRLISGFKDVPFGSLTSEHLEVAKSNLVNHFPIFGPLDEFDKILVLLAKRYTWNVSYYQRINETKSKVEAPALSPDQLNHVKSLIQLDAELFKFACSQFDDLWRKHGNQSALKALQRNNKVVKTASAIKRKLF